MTSKSVCIPEVALSSGIGIPVVGFGTAAYPFRPVNVKDAVVKAIGLGYRHFDTAALYQAEKPLGEAITEALGLGLIKSRQDLFVTSKLWCNDAHRRLVLPALQNTLRNLGLEYLDLYLIHFPLSSKPGNHELFMNKEDLLPLDLRGVWEAMEECQKLGLAKSIGVSNFSCKKLQDVLDVATIPPAVNQVEMNPFWQQKAISISNNVIVGLDFGLLLGMASALETLCGQAYGAKKYHMLGIYMQRSWIVLTACCVLLLPLYLYASPLLKLTGQPDDVAEMSGVVARWMLPLHFSFAFQFPLQRFLQSQLKAAVIAWASLAALLVHVLASWLLVSRLGLGLVGTSATLNFSWWVLVVGLFGYTVCGGCPLTWPGFSTQAFSGLWDFVKLSAASGVMLCLENWYYRVLILMTGNLKNAKIALDALSICMTINGWEMMIPLAFFAGAGVRVANELGAGNGKGAKFATVVAVTTSMVIGLFFWLLVMFMHDKLAFIFSNSKPVVEAVNHLSVLLAFTVLLNSIQPVLSGVAVGSGWQSSVAYINLGCYYLIGVPLGFVMGWAFHLGVMGIWAGMIFGGTAIQTLILCIITIRCDWDKEAEKASMHIRNWGETIEECRA